MSQEKDATHWKRKVMWCALHCGMPCVESCVSLQLSLLANLSVANQWSLKLAANEPVHHIMTFDPSDRNYLYLMTTHHVSTVSCECAARTSRPYIYISNIRNTIRDNIN